MKARTVKVVAAVVVTVLASASGAKAFPPQLFNWGNSASQVANFGAPFYSDPGGTTKLGAGANLTAGDGFLIQLIALQGGTNYVLGAATIGDDPANVQADITQGFISGFAGQFDLAGFSVGSNVLAGAFGAGTTPLGVKFFNATTVGGATAFGIVSNNTIFVPNPDPASVQTAPVIFEVDWDNNAYTGARTATLPHGFWTDTLIVVPEPSTVLLVGIGLVSAWAFRRRKA